MDQPADWEGKGYAFFQNKECEYFPCHKVESVEDFNCLFCYCPLYVLGDKCGGNCAYTDSGIKDCSGCILPHKRENFGYVTGKFQEIMEIVRRNEEA